MNSSYLFNMNQHDRSAKKGQMNSEVTDETRGPRSKQVMVSLYSVLGRRHLDYVCSIGQHPVENKAVWRGSWGTRQEAGVLIWVSFTTNTPPGSVGFSWPLRPSQCNWIGGRKLCPQEWFWEILFMSYSLWHHQCLVDHLWHNYLWNIYNIK